MTEVNMFDDPDYMYLVPEQMWNEILPRLWLGGTHDDDIVGQLIAEPRITTANFDTVVSLYAWSNPVDWHVRELRQAFEDGAIEGVNFDDVWFVAHQAYLDWSTGKRVLIRCQAGLNRSGLVMVLVLLMAGYSAVDAIALVRTKRHHTVLCNPDFFDWLLEHAEAQLMQRGLLS